MKNTQNSLFVDLTASQEELISGAFFKAIGRFFKKAAPIVPKVVFYAGAAVVLGVAAIMGGKDTYVTRTDEFGNTTRTPIQ